MDAKNSPTKHAVVAIVSLGIVALFRFALDMPWPMAFARVSFILLFLILIIGPLRKIKRIKVSPQLALWSWRGELGIWFTLAAVMHFVLLWIDRPLTTMISIGGSGYALANLIGLVALVWALLLAITSVNKVILFLGLGAWKWVHSFTYVVFYLSACHIAYYQFFSTYGDESGPDWFGYMVVIMAIIVIVLQLCAFIVEVSKHRKKLKK